MASVAVIKPETHKDIRVKNQADFSIAKDQNILPVVVQEFVAASIEFPILFVKAPENRASLLVMKSGLAFICQKFFGTRPLHYQPMRMI